MIRTAQAVRMDPRPRIKDVRGRLRGNGKGQYPRMDIPCAMFHIKVECPLFWVEQKMHQGKIEAGNSLVRS
jgi:hypothetical protein